MNSISRLPIASWNAADTQQDRGRLSNWDKVRLIIFFSQQPNSEKNEQLAQQFQVSDFHVKAVFGELSDRDIQQLKESNFFDCPALFLLAERIDFSSLNLLKALGSNLPSWQISREADYFSESLADRAAKLGNNALLQELVNIFPNLLENTFYFRHLLFYSIKGDHSTTVLLLLNLKIYQKPSTETLLVNSNEKLRKALSFFIWFANGGIEMEDFKLLFSEEGFLVKEVVEPILSSLNSTQFSEACEEASLKECSDFLCFSTYKSAHHDSWGSLRLLKKDHPVCQLYTQITEQYEELKNQVTSRLDGTKTTSVEVLSEKVQGIYPLLRQYVNLYRCRGFIQFVEGIIMPKIQQDLSTKNLADLVVLNRTIEHLETLSRISRSGLKMESRRGLLTFYVLMLDFIGEVSEILISRKTSFSTREIQFFLQNLLEKYQQLNSDYIESLAEVLKWKINMFYEPFIGELTRRSVNEPSWLGMRRRLHGQR